MRHNNFDIVRLCLALIVAVFHAAVVSDSQRLAFLGDWLSGRLAVEGFFAISGFLIFASYERSSSLKDYVIKRAYRILPAYWLSTALCLAIALWFHQFHIWGFLLANLTFLNFLRPAIPGVFDSNPYTPILNGALWTIKVEVMFYAAVPLIVWCCRRLHRDAVLWALFAASALLDTFVSPHSKWAVEIPGQLCFFMIGALIHYHLPWFTRNGRWLMVAAAVLFGIHTWTGWFVLRPVSVAVLTLGTALVLPVVRGPTRWGDFSYGTYVLHWPIIQIVTAAGLYRSHPWLALGVSLLLIAMGATFSWFLVEKPSLTQAHAQAQRRKTRIPAIISS